MVARDELDALDAQVTQTTDDLNAVNAEIAAMQAQAEMRRSNPDRLVRDALRLIDMPQSAIPANLNPAELKAGFEKHRGETEGHVERLQQIFELIGKRAQGKTCEAMKGLIKEGEILVKAEGDPDVRDAGLIGAAQRVEHARRQGHVSRGSRGVRSRMSRAHDISPVTNNSALGWLQSRIPWLKKGTLFPANAIGVDLGREGEEFLFKRLWFNPGAPLLVQKSEAVGQLMVQVEIEERGQWLTRNRGDRGGARSAMWERCSALSPGAGSPASWAWAARSSSRPSCSDRRGC